MDTVISNIKFCCPNLIADAEVHSNLKSIK